MKVEEANKIIAEFMGWEFSTDGSDDFFYLNRRWENNSYSESLDALVPVWEKLKLKPYFREVDHKERGIGCYLGNCSIFEWSYGETIQEAAAKATAKAIKEKEDEC